MEIRINGKKEDLKQALNLLELVKQKGFDSKKIVIEYNASVLPKEKWATTLLNEKDVIEIISFVGGG